ncbi:MAG: hypothetical protein JST89_25065 [Cyanobacteria bacterium SZAS-4]|nr:hypothetical protein [Cyanobacteria bacterium SZAS-4]
MQIKQAQVSDYQSQSLSLANQTVELLDRLDRKKELEFDPLKPVQKTSSPLVRRVLRPSADKAAHESSNFAPPAADAIVSVIIADSDPAADRDELTFSRELTIARNGAMRNVEPWRAESELKFAQNGKRAAEGGRYLDDDTRTRTIEIADSRLAKAQAASDAVGPTKYAQTVRALRDYAVAIAKQVASESDPTVKDKVARHLAIDLELMVRSVKNLEKGVTGDLPVVNVQEPFDYCARLARVKDHLEDKISRINSNQDRRLDRLVEQNSILAQLQNRLNELPSDGVIFFFNREGLIIKAPMSKPGNILVGVDRLEYPKSKLRPDGTFVNRDGETVKVEMTYKAIDVPRWKNAGNGPNGAGMDRFAGDDIAGAAIVRPKEGAKPIQANKRVFVEKEVVGLIGDLPKEVVEGMAFKELAKRFGNMEYGKRPIETKTA